MDEIKTYGNLAELTNALGHLAPSSDDAFKQYMDVITNKRKTEFERSLARHVLTWVVYAKAPLTLQMIIDSFAIVSSKGRNFEKHRPSRDAIISICTGLIVLDSQSNIRLVHDSVQGILRKHKILFADADLTIAKTCLYCLSMDLPHDSDTALLPYAAEYWSSHLIASKADINQEPQRHLRAMIRHFLMDTGRLVRAFNSLKKNDNMKGLGLVGMTGLHAAVYFDLRDWLKSLINNANGPNARCGDGQTALHWAVRLGRHSLVKYLVKKSADTNIADSHLNTPLHIALMKPLGNETEITRALLHGNARSDIPNKKRITALDLAIKYGPTKVAEMLLACRVDVSNETEQGWTPLREIFFAEAHCFGPSNNKSSTSWQALRDAFEHHVQRLFNIVLSKGVRLNSRTKDGWLPLTHTVSGGNVKWSERLLTRNPDPADINVRDPQDRTPLWLAFNYERNDVVRLLLKHGADVNESNSDQWTPLIEATKRKAKDLVWLLVEAGANINAKDKNGMSALHYAIQNQQKDVVWLLVNRTTESPDSSLLHSSLEHGDLSVAWLLCEHGVDINAVDSSGMPALHKACLRKNLPQVRFLLEQGADISIVDTIQGLTPLYYAVMGGDEEIMRLVASRTSRHGQMELKLHGGGTALALATCERRLDMVAILLENGASCDTPGASGATALHWAARRGFSHGLAILLSDSADPNLIDEVGYTALHHAVHDDSAAQEDQTEVINILITHKRVQLNVEEKRNSFTPLMLAASLGNFRVVRQLVEKGVDMNRINSQGKTVLDILSYERQVELQRLVRRRGREKLSDRG